MGFAWIAWSEGGELGFWFWGRVILFWLRVVVLGRGHGVVDFLGKHHGIAW